MISKTNILYNRGKNTISSNGNTTMNECIVMNNTDSPIFSGYITLINCSIPEDQIKESTNLDIHNIDASNLSNNMNNIWIDECEISFSSQQEKNDIHLHDILNIFVRSVFILLYNQCFQLSETHKLTL